MSGCEGVRRWLGVGDGLARVLGGAKLVVECVFEVVGQGVGRVK